MNISLPDKLKQWLESRVEEGRYSSASDYVRDLMSRDQDEARSKARLQAAIDAGRASPPAGLGVEDIIAARPG